MQPDIEVTADPAAPTYFNNTKAMPQRDALALVGVAVVAAGLKLYGLIPDISWLWILAPVAFVLAMSIAFGLIRNAVHEALRLAENDSFLDAKAQDAARRAEEVHLTPAKLSRKLGEVTE